LSETEGRRRLSGAQIVAEYLVRQGVPIVAGIPVVGSVGAASSLAVALASNFGLTLATFVRPGGMNLFGELGRVTSGGAAR
jgi:formate dehydrogenase assembly factor FdhD